MVTCAKCMRTAERMVATKLLAHNFEILEYEYRCNMHKEIDIEILSFDDLEKLSKNKKALEVSD